jgi:hypothetical protein
MRRVLIGIAGCAVLIDGKAFAEEINPYPVAEKVIARACYGFAGQKIPRERLAEAIRYELTEGLPDVDPISEARDPEAAALARSRNFIGVRNALQRDLAIPGTAMAKALTVSPAPRQSKVTTEQWLFTGSETFTLTCAPTKPEKPAEFERIAPITIRKTVGELALLGEDREAAASAQVSYDDLRTTNLAGDEKRTRKLVVNAAMGLTLAGNEYQYAMLFGDYSRSRARIRTSPTPIDPAKDGSADDVDVLELGLLGTASLGGWLRATGRAGVIFDNVTDASYASGTFSLVPITGGKPNLGLCNLNSFRYLGFGIDARCSFSLEGDIRHVLDKGRATISPTDMIVAVGPSVGIALRRSIDVKTGKPRDGLTASLTYKYLPVLTGIAPDLDRLDVTIAYRLWRNNIGFDFGIIYADGIERKSLADENRIGLSFGIIY